ncbi:15686_t:CDS:1 [Acaulospora colombiana]|uniref:15686_t:CDS:1 n=1 Tax=Acaulospora colombiana TaxID=27376 RepID=A0ACA9Q5U8_9GLOM|nr:15686_t:CDS:1 [Acaulospora colombiana]
MEACYLNNEEEFVKQDPIGILRTLFQYETCEPFRNSCLDIICENPYPLFDSDEFSGLDRSLLIKILEKSNLNAGEVAVWKYLLHWSAAQASITLDVTNPNSWCTENFTVLKEIFEPFIPFIRWFQINSKDFRQEILPFAPILPQNLHGDVVLYYLDPDSPPKSIPVSPKRNPLNLKSIVISPRIFTTIANWIDQKDVQGNIYDQKNNPYNFDLIFSSNTKQSAEKNQVITDNNETEIRTLVVLRPKNSYLIIGEYKIFRLHRYPTITSKNFVFSFDLSSLTGNIVRASIDKSGSTYNLRHNFALGIRRNKNGSFKFSLNWKYYPNAEKELKLGDYSKNSNGFCQYEIYKVTEKKIC